MTFLSLSLFVTKIYAADNVITSPEDGEYILNDLHLEATYMDENTDMNDPVQWAVRKGTCAAGTNTVAGNVDGKSDSYNWNYTEFTAMLDVSQWDAGEYCFVFNPKEDSGDEDIRLTREFYIVDGMVNGGGHILEGTGKKKDLYDISFGGSVVKIGTEFMGNWEVNFHNVSDPLGIVKKKFHGYQITDMNFFDGNSSTCNSAVNFTIHGKLNGEEGYKMIFRAGDNGSPNTDDTVRIQLYDDKGLIYDTYTTDFDGGSTCVGNARTDLDKGNITINTR